MDFGGGGRMQPEKENCHERLERDRVARGMRENRDRVWPYTHKSIFILSKRTVNIQ